MWHPLPDSLIGIGLVRFSAIAPILRVLPPIGADMCGYDCGIAEPYLTELVHLVEEWTQADDRLGVIEWITVGPSYRFFGRSKLGLFRDRWSVGRCS